MARALTGVVVSKKNDKTIIVAIETRKTHPVYKKQYTETKRLAVHDEKNLAKLGEKVQIKQTRPMSATKHYMLEKVVAKAGIEHIDEADVAVEAADEEKKS